MLLVENVWQVLLTASTNLLPPALGPSQQQQQQQQHQPTSVQTTFIYQQINLLVELLGFRLKNLSYTHRTTFLVLLNSLFSAFPNQASAASAASAAGSGQQPQQPQPPAFFKHPQIYIKYYFDKRKLISADLHAHSLTHLLIHSLTHYRSIQCAMLKLLSNFNGSDYFEMLNSIYISGENRALKHTPKYFISAESEEINKAIVVVIARAIHSTCKLNCHYNVVLMYAMHVLN